MRELLCTNVHDSYSWDGIAAGRATHVGQVWSDTPDKERHPSIPSWVLGMQMKISPHKIQWS